MKKNKKYIILLIAIVILVFTFDLLLKVRKVSNLSNTCLIESFNETFSNIENLPLNSEYEFSEIFDCNDWDEFLIVQAPYVNRPLIYIMSGGILLPKYDYINASDNTYFLFFIENRNIVNNPIVFSDPYFIFSQNFNNFNYVKIDRLKANFIYKKFENSDFDLYTLETLLPLE